MSLDFDIAPYCKGKYCTNLLTARVDFENGYCGLCLEDMQDHLDKQKEESKIKEEKDV
jgi:hypothetical protein